MPLGFTLDVTFDFNLGKDFEMNNLVQNPFIVWDKVSNNELEILSMKLKRLLMI